jgi:hypothetical protein
LKLPAPEAIRWRSFSRHDHFSIDHSAGTGIVAGLVNAIASSGTIVAFPALIFTGISSIGANATSTAALLPGALANCSVIVVIFRRFITG